MNFLCPASFKFVHWIRTQIECINVHLNWSWTNMFINTKNRGQSQTGKIWQLVTCAQQRNELDSPVFIEREREWEREREKKTKLYWWQLSSPDKVIGFMTAVWICFLFKLLQPLQSVCVLNSVWGTHLGHTLYPIEFIAMHNPWLC